MAKKAKLAKKQALDLEVAQCSNGITSPNSSEDKQFVLEDVSGLELKNSTFVAVECGVQTNHNTEEHVAFQYTRGGSNQTTIKDTYGNHGKTNAHMQKKIDGLK